MLFGIRAYLDSMFPVCYTTSSSPERTTVAAPDGKQPSRRLSLRRPLSPGFPKGPQPLGTLTLLARSSVLYLRARDRRIRPAALRFSLLPGAKGYRAPLSSPPSDTAILYARILLVAFPRSVSNQFHNTWHLQPFGSRFRMTASACSMPFYLQEECRYTLRDKQISKKPQKVRKQDSKAPFPTHVNSRGRIWIRPHQGFYFSRFPHGYMEGRLFV